MGGTCKQFYGKYWLLCESRELWSYEAKLDGYRWLAAKHSSGVVLCRPGAMKQRQKNLRSTSDNRISLKGKLRTAPYGGLASIIE